ncbi:hypothetical protein [Sphingomonas hengshuiensis]|uniref:Uncharacterized protein n=1 Tax=Sphingomonas hengshuiensis TaxID=1609977 RepID=A0A7U4J8E8_9SPHN|nr:hypothetical protein [Sphingomonas hengshuiensis]AJP72160.1 hypothetical protein TS85_10720 [Sphingomonas hengshuiensis]
MARVLLFPSDQEEAGVRWRDRRTGLGIVLAALLVVALARPVAPAALEIGVQAHAVDARLRIGFASIAIAFDSGHYCPESDGCAGAAR